MSNSNHSKTKLLTLVSKNKIKISGRGIWLRIYAGVNQMPDAWHLVVKNWVDISSVITTIISWVRRDESSLTRFWRSNFVVLTGNWFRFQGQLVGFDVNGSKAREIVGDDIVTIENKDSCPWQRRNFESSKLRHRNSVAPYSTDNRSIKKCQNCLITQTF